jgi:hypothetical protein
MQITYLLSALTAEPPANVATATAATNTAANSTAATAATSAVATADATALPAAQIRTIAIIAEGVPESQTRAIIKEADKRGVGLIGPATVGGIKPGCMRIGNTGGMLDNIVMSKLYRPGRQAFSHAVRYTGMKHILIVLAVATRRQARQLCYCIRTLPMCRVCVRCDAAVVLCYTLQTIHRNVQYC